MAIAVPFLLTAAGATATTVAMVSVAFAVTGINQKIDKAASNVFGEDLVKVATIAGIGYSIFNGGFDIDGFGEGAASTAEGLSAADMAGGLDPAFGTTEAYNAAANMGGAEAVANTSLGSTLDAVAPGMEIAEGTSSGFNLQDIAGSTKAAVQASDAAVQTALPQTTDVGRIATTGNVTAAPTGAAASNATSDLSSVATKATAAASNATKAATGPSSFLQRLKDTATSPVVMGSMIQGAAGGYASAAAQEAQREMYDKQMAERKRLASIGSAGYRVKG
jgi:hypothetical protein